MTSLVISTAESNREMVPATVLQPVAKVTLYIDPLGDAWQRAYLPISADTVNRLRLLQQVGGVQMAEQPLPTDDFRATEMAWLQAHLQDISTQYPGQWIAVQGMQLVAHAHSLDELYEQAAAAGYPDPFVTAVPATADQLFIACQSL